MATDQEKLAAEAAKLGLDPADFSEGEEQTEAKAETVEEAPIAEETEETAAEAAPEEEATTEEPVQEEIREFTEIEKSAMDQGWKPDVSLEEGKEFISAEEFLRRGELFDKIANQKGEINNLKHIVKKFSEEFKNVQQRSYEKALAEIEAKQREAAEIGDIEAFDKAKDDAAKLNAEIKEQVDKLDVKVEEEAKTSETIPEFEDFKKRNDFWYNTDNFNNYQMVKEAESFEQYLLQTKPHLTVKEALLEIEGHVREKFPGRFANPNKTKAAAVTAAPKGTVATKNAVDDELPDVSELTETQKMLYNQARAGNVPGMTGKEYLKTLTEVYNKR